MRENDSKQFPISEEKNQEFEELKQLELKKDKKLQINWIYVFVILLLGILIGGGILGYQWWISRKSIQQTTDLEKKPTRALTKGEVSVERIKLHTIPEDLSPVNNNEIQFSSDGNHFAYEARKGGTYYLVIDGKLLGPFQEVYFKEFCSSGEKYLYTVKTDSEWFVYMNKEIVAGPFEKRYTMLPVIFSPDCNYLATATQQSVTIFGPKEEKKYTHDKVDSPFFSSNSDSFAFSAERAGKKFMVVNGKEEKAYEQVFDTSFIFSEDGKRYAYIVAPEGYKGSRLYIIDGTEQSEHQMVKEFVFSPDGKNYAYAYTSSDREDSWFVIYNGKVTTGPFYEVSDLNFSPDSKRFAYKIQPDLKRAVYQYVVDGKQWGEHLRSWDFKFSPDSKRFTYITWGGLVVDDELYGQFYDQILDSGTSSPVAFSPDSQQVAYIGVKVIEPEISLKQLSEEEIEKLSEEEIVELFEKIVEKRENFIVINGQQHGPHSNISDLQFSPKGNLVFIESEKRLGSREYADLILANFKEVARFDIVFNTGRDPASGRIIFNARGNRDLFRILLKE